MTKQVKLLDLKPAQFLAVCYTSKRLTEAIDNIIYRYSDYDFDEFVVNYINGNSEYSIGLFNSNQIEVKDTEAFFDAMTEKAKSVATSQEVDNALAKCRKLKDKGSNLFSFTVRNELRNALLKEVNGLAKRYEDLSMAVYNKETTDERLNDFVVESIMDNEEAPFNQCAIELPSGKVLDLTPVGMIEGAKLHELIREAASV